MRRYRITDDQRAKLHETHARVRDYVSTLAGRARVDYRLMWEHEGPPDTSLARIECWLVGRYLLLAQLYYDTGYTIFVQDPANRTSNAGMDATLKFWAEASKAPAVDPDDQTAP